MTTSSLVLQIQRHGGRHCTFIGKQGLPAPSEKLPTFEGGKGTCCKCLLHRPHRYPKGCLKERIESIISHTQKRIVLVDLESDCFIWWWTRWFILSLSPFQLTCDSTQLRLKI